MASSCLACSPTLLDASERRCSTPHLTVRGDTGLAVAALVEAIPEVASDVSAFSEAIAAIETSDAYFRSFYAHFNVSAPLAELKQRLVADATCV